MKLPFSLRPNRREFVKNSAALLALTGVPMDQSASPETSREASDEFTVYQERRRWELWNLLGDLPWDHEPRPPKLLKTERREGYTIERLELDWLVPIGGDDTLSYGERLAREGVRVVAVPKTMDNDVFGVRGKRTGDAGDR